MSDSINDVVFRSTLIDVAVAFVLIVAAYWRPMRWPVLIGAMIAFPPLLWLRPSSGVVLFSLFAAMWLVAWKRVPGWIAVAVPAVAVALVIPFNMEAHRTSLSRIETLRNSFPQRNLAERLRYETRSTDQVALAPSPHSPMLDGSRIVPAALEAISDEMADVEPETTIVANMSGRAHILRQLHEGAYDHFVSLQGFGAERMLYHWEATLWPGPEDYYPLPPPPREPPAYPDDLAAAPEKSASEGAESPGSLPTDPGGTTALKRPSPYRPGVDLAAEPLKGHRQAKLAFLDPETWGYVTKPQTAFGFEPHAIRQHTEFTRSPNLVESADWRLTSLQLVGLLKHDRPMAYVSARLPDMGALQKAPVRPLDPFEAAALERIRSGEELVIDSVSAPDRIVMLGAIRAGQGCLACHSVDKGTLLGAFSYRLDRALQQRMAPAAELR